MCVYMCRVYVLIKVSESLKMRERERARQTQRERKRMAKRAFYLQGEYNDRYSHMPESVQ